ncbi:MAG: hypothetical protein ACP5M4_14285 [Acidobacteriaceae bacterium]
MRFRGIVVGLAVMLVAAGAWAQQPTVEQFLSGVRAKYATEPRLAQEGFACEVKPEWMEFPQVKYVGANSPLLERLKRTRVRLMVAKGGTPLVEVDKARKPELDVRDLATVDQLMGSVRQMVQGFYQTWLPFGIMGPSAPAGASMQTMTVKPVGLETVIQYKQGATTDWMSFDSESRMLHFTQLLPQGNAVMESPQFEASGGGLLYTGTRFEIHDASSQGKPDTLGAYRVEYQKVDGLRVPKTVEVEVNGTLDVHFEFSDCRVGD